MANNASAVDGYNFRPEDKLFVDANVWLFVYGPQRPGDARVAVYSQALAKILSARSRIYIDVLIVSEFINTYARLQWNIKGKPRTEFKRFRKSADFKPLAQDIAADVKRVLSHCERIEDGFEALDIDGLISEFADGNSDFNDQVIVTLCKARALTLITDDSDFGTHGIQVVTANRRLLG